ncbi:MAG: acetamidase, partial [bacterium]
MCQNRDHTIHGANHHFGWDNSFSPAVMVAPGDRLHLECLDSSAGQFT